MESTNSANVIKTDNNFVQTGLLNNFKDYKEEYIKTLEALVESQKELLEALRKSQVVIAPPPNGIGTAQLVPYTVPYVPPTISPSPYPYPNTIPNLPNTNPTIICGGHTANMIGEAYCYNSADIQRSQSMGPEYAG